MRKIMILADLLSQADDYKIKKGSIEIEISDLIYELDNDNFSVYKL